MRFGVLLPHCGAHCSRERIIEGSQLIERLGYDTIWVRDHLIFRPHGMEGTDPTFVDAFLTLAAIAGATKTIALGTAVIIPIRWPLKVAQNFASLSYLANRRIEVGFGLGANPAEFAAAGFDVENREKIFIETIRICERVWKENDVSWDGEMFQFEHVTLEPKPVGPMPTWYGGSTRASCRRAAAHTDGWLPGRVPLATLDNRLELLGQLAAERGRPIAAGTLPLWCVDDDREKARAIIDVDAIAHSSEGAKNWIMPPSGKFETIEDLEGILICGDPDDCVAEIEKFKARGLTDLVVDLRLQFDDWEEKLELIAEKVLPRVR